MNYGRFFRLNKNISKVEEGVVIFDYIDLPAYFESSMENVMTPKYPISVTIASSSIQFRLHYSAYKNIDEETGEVTYSYDGGKNVVHMEEIVLELPFSESSSDRLAETINSIYETSFPQRVDANDHKEEVDTNENKVMGGRFLGMLIHKRYHGKYRGTKNNIEEQQCENMRKALDRLPSYSTLWLMGVPREANTKTAAESISEAKNKDVIIDDSPLNLLSNNGDIVKFLRKLLLDFMFDLKHSDVFQNSSNYQRAYSGLMSDFYFVALMHKCDYYYYRQLSIEAINSIPKQSSIYKAKYRIGQLYAQELANAETLWIQDIMSPNAEKYFETKNFSKRNLPLTNTGYIKRFIFFIVFGWLNIKDSFFRELYRYKFNVWNSWFAEPEEELRRVCFTMSEPLHPGIMEFVNSFLIDLLEFPKIPWGKVPKIPWKEWFNDRWLSFFGIFDNPKRAHICNAGTLYQYLDYRISDKQKDQINNNTIQISRWFIKRYDFSDIFHLHIFNYANILLVASLLLIFYHIFTSPEALTCEYWTGLFPKIIIHRENIIIGNIGWIAIILIPLLWLISRIPEKNNEMRPLIFTRQKHVFIKVLRYVTFGFYMLCVCQLYSNWGQLDLRYIYLIIACVLGFYYLKRITPYLHIFFPRLVASITSAWLTLVIGNELFGTFFDSIVSWTTVVLLSIVVLAFVIYEINHLLPKESFTNKFLRGGELILISYAIAFTVGLFVINFTGKRFLERSGVLENFYSEYVDVEKNIRQVENNKFRFVSVSANKVKADNDPELNGNIAFSGKHQPKDSIIKANGEQQGRSSQNDRYITDADRLRGLKDVYIITPPESVRNNNRPIVRIWHIDNAEFFVLREFLIQFSFLAMFIGIFITMLFQDKTITET